VSKRKTQIPASRTAQVAAIASAGQFRRDETTMYKIVWNQYRQHRLAVISSVVFLIIILLAVFAPVIAPYDPTYIDPTVFDEAPSRLHLLGTDRVGRDVLSRLIYGGRVSLSVGIVAVLIFIVIGTFLGAVAGYYGGVVDAVISRFIDIVLSFPQLMLILVLVSLLGPGLRNIMLVIGLLGWPQVARIVRGEFLRLRVQEFVQAATIVGSRNSRIITRHLLPNAMGPVLVSATFGVDDPDLGVEHHLYRGWASRCAGSATAAIALRQPFEAISLGGFDIPCEAMEKGGVIGELDLMIH